MDEIKTFFALKNSGLEGWTFTAVFIALMFRGLLSFVRYIISLLAKAFDFITKVRVKNNNIDLIPNIEKSLHEIKENHRVHEKREEESFIEIRKDFIGVKQEFNNFKETISAEFQEVKKHLTAYQKRTHSLENDKTASLNQFKELQHSFEENEVILKQVKAILEKITHERKDNK